MTLPYYVPSRIMVDAFGPSPLVADLEVRSPKLHAMAVERGPAPTLFATGDLPPFTASGVDPAVLSGLPYNWRHAAASEADRNVVLSWLEEVAMDRDRYAVAAGPKSHPGLLDYQARMEGWTHGLLAPDVSWEEAAYLESMKPAYVKQREANLVEAERLRVEEQRLQRDLTRVTSAKPLDYEEFNRLVSEIHNVQAELERLQ